jgi:single-strand DNA-binding protein
MAADLNQVVLIGRLTRDAELKYTNSGLQICRFSIANNYRRKQGENWVEETNFFDLFMMGRRAEALHRYLTKGTQVAIQGQLRHDRWEQDGQPRSRVEVFVSDLQLLGGGRGQAGSTQAPSGQASGGQSGPSQSSDTDDNDFEDDVPF